MSLFSKKNIILNTEILLVLLVFHFIFMTFIRFQLGGDLHIWILHSNIWNLWKDFYLLIIYGIILWYLIKTNKLKYRIIKNKYLYIFFIIIIFSSLIISISNFHWFKELVIWVKYDLWFLFPVIFFSSIDFDKKDINKLYSTIMYIIKLTITLCLIYCIIRFTWPKFLYLLWYWPIWNWTSLWYPPLLFKTWFDWIQRLSGIFSWPNHMAFYLITFWPIIIFSIFSKRLHYIWWLIYIFLLLGTLSRSWILALFLEISLIFIFIFKYYKNYRKIILSLVIASWLWIVSLGSYLYLSWKYKQIILRWASTAWHKIKSLKTIKDIIKNPLWHWIWTAWPAAHYIKNDIVPESRFLQIFYELWIYVWLLWFSFIFYIIYLTQKNINITYPYMQKIDILKISLSIWIIWLLSQWLVLHSFEDSMTTLPLFILIWIILSLNKNNV